MGKFSFFTTVRVYERACTTHIWLIELPTHHSRWMMRTVIKPAAVWAAHRLSGSSLGSNLPDRWLVSSLVAQVSNHVYQFVLQHCSSEAERVFCLPIGQHSACAAPLSLAAAAVLDDVSFVSMCRKAAGWQASSKTRVQTLLARMDAHEVVVIAKYLAHTRRATIEDSTVRVSG